MKVKVIVRDQKTLVLEEDAKKGDIIDLNELTTVDLDLIEKAISDNKDKVYNDKFNALQKSFNQEKENLLVKEQVKHNEEIAKLNQVVQDLKNQLFNKEKEITNKYELKLQTTINDSKSKEKDIEVRYDKDLQALKDENKRIKEQQELLINSIKSEKEKELLAFKEETNQKYILEKEKTNEIINNLNLSLTRKQSETDIALLNKEKELKLIYEKEINNLKDEITSKTNALNELTFQKSIKNVKQTGEDLEAWCDNEVTSYMQNGLENCEWIKDNDVIKEKDETKGSKADYLLKIYASSERKENELLTSICMDMKDENPDSVNKKKNEDYYKQLDKNRNKKNCKYALLVSNLERDKVNDLPMFKVRSYEDMYVVRPEYLMVFLNLVVSLNVKFKELLIETNKEKQLYLDSLELEEEFEKLKNTYLDKPLETLEKQVKEIGDQTEKIITAADKIKEANRKIVNNYIDEIKNKLDRFNIKRLSKKLDKIN